jgi:hypothetical protein
LGAHTEDPSKKTQNKKLRLKIDPYARLNLKTNAHRTHGVNRLIATTETIFYGWKQSPVFFLGAVEERANMTRLIKLGTSKGNGSRGLSHAHPINI